LVAIEVSEPIPGLQTISEVILRVRRLGLLFKGTGDIISLGPQFNL